VNTLPHQTRSSAGLVLGGLLIATVAVTCTEATVEPTVPDPVRTVLYSLSNGPGLFAVRSDGTGDARVRVPSAIDSMVLLGMSRDGGRLALLADDGIYVYSPSDTLSLVRALDLPPNSILPAAFSDDERFLALITFANRPLVLVADLVDGVVDTLVAVVTDPVLPVAFSPDGRRLVVIGANDFTLEIVTIERESGISSSIQRVGGSRLVDIPIFGWPRWSSHGLQLAVRRRPFTGNTGPDTLIGVTLDIDDVERGYTRRFRAASDLRFDVASTFAYSSDGDAIVYGALSADGTTHGLFFQSANTPVVQLVRDDPVAGEVFPQMVNGTLPVPLR